jgi:hypothetical protein
MLHSTMRSLFHSKIVSLSVPLAWFPRLLEASPDARERVEISRIGLNWEELDEDISIAGLLAGRGAMTKQAQRAV